MMKIRNFSLLLILTLPVSQPIFSQNCGKITLQKIYQDYLFEPKSIIGIRSMADGEHFTVIESGKNIVGYDYETGKKKNVLFSAGLANNNKIRSIDDYELSKNEEKILLTTEVSKIYRHSFEALYWIYDISKRTLIPLNDTGKQQLATFSPDGLKVAFVMNNNLFYKDIPSGTIKQITTDGVINNIINGKPDWVYEEEFGFSQGFYWSPDSRSIAFYRFDESNVRQFDMTVYNGLYPSVQRFKYPKAGEDNSLVTIHVYHIASGKTIKMDTGQETDQYIPRIKWTANRDKLCMIRLNRLQNKVDVLFANAETGESDVVYKEEHPKYLSRIDDNYIHFTADGKHFIILSERSGFYHYYYYSITGELINPITTGNWEINGDVFFDESRNIMYYQSNEISAINKDVYSVRLNGKDKHRLSTVSGSNRAEFSSTFKYYINVWSDANTPPKYALYRINGSLIRELEDNSFMVNELKNHRFLKKEFIKIPVSEDLELNGYIIKPCNFDSTRQYALFMSVYGGPESQDVTNSWDSELPWQQMLAHNDIVVMGVDNRGTDGRGDLFRKSTYLQLGKLETEDQVNAAKFMARKTWIDKSRIGIWGWSYGGYMTLLCLTKGADVFKMGIAVAPVTNWRFYDNIYTERFMRKPQDNPSGYDENSPLNFAGLLNGKLLLIHGTGDDNVHFQNSIEMVDQLILKNKQFNQFFYPDKNHSIYGGNTRYHLYSMMTNYILENL